MYESVLVFCWSRLGACVETTSESLRLNLERTSVFNRIGPQKEAGKD